MTSLNPSSLKLSKYSDSECRDDFRVTYFPLQSECSKTLTQTLLCIFNEEVRSCHSAGKFVQFDISLSFNSSPGF